jgi:AraC-like DNA-binding protein
MATISDTLLDLQQSHSYERQEENDSASLVEIITLKKGETLNRTVARFEIVFVSSGMIRIHRDGWDDMVVRQKMFFLLPPGCVLSGYAEEDSELIVCRYDRQTNQSHLTDILDLRELTAPVGFDMDIYPVVFKHVITRYIKELTDCVKHGLRYRPYLLAKYTELLFILRRNYSKRDLVLLFRPMLGKDMEFRSFVYRNVDRCNSVKDMADLYNKNERSFRYKFQQEMGMSPGQFILDNKKTRVLHYLLHTTKPLKQICEELEFKDQSHLSHFCLIYFQKTPSKIRKLQDSDDKR